MNEMIKDVSCSKHTLFLTRSNKIYGCGMNNYCQLFKNAENDRYSSPIHIKTMEADQVVACGWNTFILSRTGKLENPAKKIFKQQNMINNQNPPMNAKELNPPKVNIKEQYQPIKIIKEPKMIVERLNPKIVQDRLRKETIETPIKAEPVRKLNDEQDSQPPKDFNANNSILIVKIDSLQNKIEEQNKISIEQKEKIDSLIEMNRLQSQSIAQLMEVCSSLQQQNEATKMKMKKMKEENQKQSKEFHDFYEEQRAHDEKDEELRDKIESVVQYVKDQDYF